MQYAIENLKKQGITDIILGISYHADKIKDYFKDGSELGVSIQYSVEEIPLGTGGAVKQAAEKIDETFILVWGDTLMDVNFNEVLDIHKETMHMLQWH